MAVAYSNNNFDWCNQLIEVKRNYNVNECKNILKNSLTTKVFPGIDEKFSQDVRNCDNSKLMTKLYYFPVYKTTYTATYNLTTEETVDKIDVTVTKTTDHQQVLTFNENIYKGLSSNCKPDSYVGRSDQRFYKLSHVDDLDAKIYHSSNVFSSMEMRWKVESYAKSRDPGVKSEIFLNNFSSTVFFVPLIEITYMDGQQPYGRRDGCSCGCRSGRHEQIKTQNVV